MTRVGLLLALAIAGCRDVSKDASTLTVDGTVTGASSTTGSGVTSGGTTTGTTTSGTYTSGTSTGTTSGTTTSTGGTTTFTVPAGCTVDVERTLNGASDTSEYRVYDGAYDDLVLLEVYDAPFQGGALTQRIEVDRDASGYATQRRTDEDGDGSWDDITSWTWSAQGELLTLEADEDGDGLIDTSVVNSWVGGLLTERTVDVTGDGNPELTFVFAYDPDDRLETMTQTGPGPNTALTTRSYLFSAPALDHDETYDAGIDGDVDRTAQRIYDSYERLVSESTDDQITGESVQALYAWTSFDAVSWGLITEQLDGIDVSQLEANYTFDAMDRPLTESFQDRVPGATSGWVDDELNQSEWIWSCP